MAKGKKKKKRQSVKRHFKPSLGKWVENYDRTGENAKAKVKSPRRTGADEPAQADAPDSVDVSPIETAWSDEPTTRRSSMASRIVVVCGLLLLVGAGYAAVRLATHSRPREFEVHAARKPFVVRIDHQPATHVATADTTGRNEMIRETIDAVVDARRRHPDKLVVLDLKSPKISFHSLEAADQILLESHYGPRADEVYQSSVARFLGAVLDATGGDNVAVLGLPVEPGEAGPARARQTNRSYRGVLRRVDHLVTAHLFFRNDSTLDEKQVIEEALPEALSLRGGRPVIFRQNVTWRALVDKGGGTRTKVLADAHR